MKWDQSQTAKNSQEVKKGMYIIPGGKGGEIQMRQSTKREQSCENEMEIPNTNSQLLINRLLRQQEVNKSIHTKETNREEEFVHFLQTKIFNIMDRDQDGFISVLDVDIESLKTDVLSIIQEFLFDMADNSSARYQFSDFVSYLKSEKNMYDSLYKQFDTIFIFMSQLSFVVQLFTERIEENRKEDKNSHFSWTSSLKKGQTPNAFQSNIQTGMRQCIPMNSMSETDAFSQHVEQQIGNPEPPLNLNCQVSAKFGNESLERSERNIFQNNLNSHELQQHSGYVDFSFCEDTHNRSNLNNKTYSQSKFVQIPKSFSPTFSNENNQSKNEIYSHPQIDNEQQKKKNENKTIGQELLVSFSNQQQEFKGQPQFSTNSSSSAREIKYINQQQQNPQIISGKYKSMVQRQFKSNLDH